MNKLRRAICALGVLSISVLAIADDLKKREDDLYEYIQDINALINAGISKAELSRRMPDLNIKFDRYVRNGGSSDSGIGYIVKSFRELENKWEEGNAKKIEVANWPPQFRVNVEQLMDDQLQRYFGYVQKSITNYEDEKKERSAAKSQKKNSARKNQ